MAMKIIRLKQARKLRKPLKSTVKAVRDRFERSGIFPPYNVIAEIALSEDQYIEDWKASLILVLNDSASKKAVTKALRSRKVAATVLSAPVRKAKGDSKKPVRRRR
jgi:hypothetical protein